MTERFRCFVIFAGMRTGSNLLEATLNQVRRVTCFGEAFNPYMMGWPGKDQMLGVTRDEREANPIALFKKLRSRDDHLQGFRYFHDHDPRVFDAIMDDPSCAKIVLTRNPLDSYVSTRLAWETNQWKLNETETPTPARITYDHAEFSDLLDVTEQFLSRISQRLQTSGQSAFWLNYDDLRDAGVMTGLLHWLGRRDIDRLDVARDQVPQNPQELSQKVENFAQMQADLATIDPFQMHRIPNFEPRRGPAVPGFLASDAGRGLIFMPIKGGPDAGLRNWLGTLGAVEGNFTQSTLKQWKRGHPGHRSFTVLRHPLLRAWSAFLDLLSYASADLRQLMRDTYRVPLPPDDAIAHLGDEESAALFSSFLDFLRRNLNGQTSLATHPHWASQSEVVSGFARFGAPDMLMREDQLVADMHHLTQMAAIADARLDRLAADPYPEFLNDPALTKAAQAAYLRDYIAFGFDKAPPAPA